MFKENFFNLVSFNWFWGTLWQHRRLYIQVIFAALIINVFSLISPLFVMNVYDRVIPNYATTTLWTLSTAIIFIYTFDMFLRFARSHIIDHCGKQADKKISEILFSHISDLQLVAKPKNIGGFISGIRDFDNVREFFTSATLAGLIDLPFVILFMILMGYLGGLIVVAVILGALLIIAFAFFSKDPLHYFVSKSQSFTAQKQGVLVETMMGIETIKSCNAQKSMGKKWNEAYHNHTEYSLKSRLILNSISNFSYYVQQLVTIFTVIIGVYLIHEGSMTLGALIACNILSGRVLAPLNQLTTILIRLQQARYSLKEIQAMMELPVEHAEEKHVIQHPIFEGNIDFIKVNFAYPNQPLNALENISFSVKSKEKIAILGAIGTGKSTLQKLLLRLYQPQSGAIYVDELDITHLDPDSIRENIGYISQDVALFSGTIRDNIIIRKPDASDEELIAAAKLAGIHDFIAHHPLGYEMPIRERGENLSGGQRQAVAIARALLDNPPIILFDEATSAMDERSELELIQRLKPFLENKTCLIITHRMSWVSIVDRIIILDDSKIKVDGKRDQVLNLLRQAQQKGKNQDEKPQSIASSNS